MHKVYENDDLMMYFKKRYCHCCGKVLQKKRTERIVRKGDPDHKVYCHIGTTYKPYGDILVIGKEYFCLSCNKSFSCDDQGKVIEAQKHYQRNVVTEEEITNVKNQHLMIANDRIFKIRWILLIPIIGFFICNFVIFNGYLSEKTKSKDLYKLTLSSVLFFIGVALIIKLVIQVSNIDINVNYKTLIMLIPSLVSFNLPTLWYINHTFKRK